jgi:hypothetical protein
MFRRNFLPLWAAIIVLASTYLMGQGWSPEVVGPPAPVAKTGQTTSYATGDDGDWQKGVASPDPRFTDNGDGTVTDNLTALIWTKDANCPGLGTWTAALDYCNALSAGTCGLSDGSKVGDWRLPNVRELQSLVDYANHDPALPTGHPFTNVQYVPGLFYWSSTTRAFATGSAWMVNFRYGGVDDNVFSGVSHACCVRDGQ